MRIIVITSPEIIPGEVSLINTLMEGGVWRLHIRKPQASLEEVRQLIEGIDRRLYPQLSLHDHHALAMEYGCGISLFGYAVEYRTQKHVITCFLSLLRLFD